MDIFGANNCISGETAQNFKNAVQKLVVEFLEATATACENMYTSYRTRKSSTLLECM